MTTNPRRPHTLNPATRVGELPDETAMIRSGLALVGANQQRSGTEDGIVTAFELAALDLESTRLVVLSACETGLEPWHSPEKTHVCS